MKPRLITRMAIEKFRKIERLSMRVMQSESELNALLEYVPEEDMEYYTKETEKIRAEENKWVTIHSGRRSKRG